MLKDKFEALILAGGRGSRMGGIDKASIQLHGQSLISWVISAAREAGAERVTVVGPESAGHLADLIVREEPAFAGPLAGIAAGIGQIKTKWVLVLACDLQRPQVLVQSLMRAAERTEIQDGIILIDEESREQWLAGFYRCEALSSACERLGQNVINAPVRKVLKELDLCRVPIATEDSLDIDTPEALEQARAEASSTENGRRN